MLISRSLLDGRKLVKESPWKDVSPRSRAVKTLWSQWDRLLFRNGVLCRKWENDVGDQITNQIVLPDTLRQTALEAHHSHTTASHRGVRKTIKRSSVSLLLARTYVSSSSISRQVPCLWIKERHGEGNVVLL